MFDKALYLWQDIQDMQNGDESVTYESVMTQINELTEELDDAGYIPSESIQTTIFAMVEADSPSLEITGFLATLAAWFILVYAEKPSK